MLGNKFDHGAEAIVPVLFNLIPNCAKVMATSGVSAIRIIIRVSFANTRTNSVLTTKNGQRKCYGCSLIIGICHSLLPLLSAAHPRPQAHPPDSQ